MKSIMVYFFAVALTVLLVMACGSQVKRLAHGSDIQYLTENSPKIEYTSYSYLIDEFEHEAKRQKWSDEERENQKRIIPPGGIITVHFESDTIENANSGNYTVVLELEGEEIDRKTGRDEEPQEIYRHDKDKTYYWSKMVVNVTKELKEPLKVYVIDMLSSIRHEYAVIPEALLE